MWKQLFPLYMIVVHSRAVYAISQTLRWNSNPQGMWGLTALLYITFIRGSTSTVNTKPLFNYYKYHRVKSKDAGQGRMESFLTWGEGAGFPCTYRKPQNQSDFTEALCPLQHKWFRHRTCSFLSTQPSHANPLRKGRFNTNAAPVLNSKEDSITSPTSSQAQYLGLIKICPLKPVL